jgi:hypothetical protein
MTQDELDIETLRYRGPTIVPLPGSHRLAVLTPGLQQEQGREYVICSSMIDAWSTAITYIEYNKLPEPAPRTKRAAAPPRMTEDQAFAALGLTKDEALAILAKMETK